MFDENAEHENSFIYFSHSSVPGVNLFKMVGVNCDLIPQGLVLVCYVHHQLLCNKKRVRTPVSATRQTE